MNSFHAFAIACSFVIIMLILITYFMIRNYLVIIKNLLFDIKGLFYQFRDDRYDTRNFAKEIRDNSSAILDRLDEEPKEDDPNEDRTGDVWALAPCPECGGPASMHYDHESGDGYFVVCSKYSRGEGCRYSIVTGGSTRRLAATEWNRNVVNYARKKVQVEANND